VRNPAPLATPEALNQSWSIDFMHDALVCGRRFRTFNVVDDFNREALAIEIDLNIPAQRVIRVLDRIVANRGYPLKLRMDNGPELVSLTLAQWPEEHGVALEFIKPGKPTQNAFIERFNRTYRTEILDFYLFRTLNEAREITECWLTEYNSERPYESLNNLTPEEYRLMAEKPEISKVRGTKTGVLTLRSTSKCLYLDGREALDVLVFALPERFKLRLPFLNLFALGGFFLWSFFDDYR
jgi:putative transposase